MIDDDEEMFPTNKFNIGMSNATEINSNMVPMRIKIIKKTNLIFNIYGSNCIAFLKSFII